MTKLRKFAQGQPCLVRIPNCCNHDPSTTVLAHVSRKGLSGMGMKPPDLVGVHACSSCHDVIDGRVLLPGLTKLELDSMILDALCRTLAKVAAL